MTPGEQVGVPRVVAFGIDTLYLHWKVPLATDLVAKLVELRDQAAALPLSKGGGIAIFEAAGHRFDVQPHASRTAPLFLHCENVMDVHLNPSPPIAAMPTVTVELRSVWLWQRGPHCAVADACALLLELVPDGVELPAAQLVPQVTRVDVAADFQWGDVLQDNLTLLFPAALKKADPNDPGLRTRAEAFASYWRVKKKRCTGATYGEKTSDVSAGIYNKTEEVAKASGKTWFEEVWKLSPDYVAGEDVWRLEFRLKREGLRSLQCPSIGRELLTWPDVADHLEAVWRYLTGEWLVWRGKRTSSERNTIDRRWRPFHELDVGAEFHQGCATVLRKRIDKVGEMAVAQLCGYLSQVKAHVELELERVVPFDEAWPWMWGKVEDHGQRSGRTVELRCEEKRRRLEQVLAVASAPPATPQLAPRMSPGTGARMAAAAARRAEQRRRFVEGQRATWKEGAK